MAIVFTGKIIAKLRKRLEWQQERLLDEMEYYSPDISKVETGKQVPRTDSLSHVFEVLNAPMGELICPHLEGQPMEIYELRDRLARAFECNDLIESESLYSQISSMINMAGLVNKQYFLYITAKLYELQGQPIDIILPLVIEAIRLTYPNFDENKSPGKNILVLEEPGLFHLLAKLYIQQGKIDTALRILEETYSCMKKSISIDFNHDKKTLTILLTLVKQLFDMSSYELALNRCDEAMDISATYCFGQFLPDLYLLKSQILLLIKPDTECEPLLYMSYACFTLLGDAHNANIVKAHAQSDYGVTLDTYEIERLYIPPSKNLTYARGSLADCHSIGDLIRIERKRLGLSLEELSLGICHLSALGKIEKNQLQGKIEVLEPILERLGRSPSLYYNFFLDEREYQIRRITDRISVCLRYQHYDEMDTLLKVIKEGKKFEQGTKLQFALWMESELQESKKPDNNTEIISKAIDALKITCPNFIEDDIHKYPLTLQEAKIINTIACFRMDYGENERAAKILSSLIDNFNRRYVDEADKARLYSVLMINYSSCLGRLGMRKKAIEIIELAENFERDRGRLSELPTLCDNKGSSLFKMGNHTNSLPNLLLAYYGLLAFSDYGDHVYLDIAKLQLKEFFNRDM